MLIEEEVDRLNAGNSTSTKDCARIDRVKECAMDEAASREGRGKSCSNSARARTRALLAAFFTLSYFERTLRFKWSHRDLAHACEFVAIRSRI